MTAPSSSLCVPTLQKLLINVSSPAAWLTPRLIRYVSELNVPGVNFLFRHVFVVYR